MCYVEVTLQILFCFWNLFSAHTLRWRSFQGLDSMSSSVLMEQESRRSCVEFASDSEESQAFWVVPVQSRNT